MKLNKYMHCWLWLYLATIVDDHIRSEDDEYVRHTHMTPARTSISHVSRLRLALLYRIESRRAFYSLVSLCHLLADRVAPSWRVSPPFRSRTSTPDGLDRRLFCSMVRNRTLKSPSWKPAGPATLLSSFSMPILPVDSSPRMLTQVSHTNGHLLTAFQALSQTEEEISTSQFHTSDLYGLLYLFARTRQLNSNV